MTDPFALVRPSGRGLPILISSPHSGLFYPPDAMHALGVSVDSLAALSDGPVHELVEPAVAEGATLIRALWSRAWIDLNREPAELDADAIAGIPDTRAARRSLRVRAGLGVVPTRLGERRVHQRPLSYADVASRIASIHLPYHAAIEGGCSRLIERFGQVLLLDCHSMPGAATGVGAVPEVALGDRFGRSCSTVVVQEVERLFGSAGFSVARNRPFAGGWITERHGRPNRNVHALQIELRRDLFLDCATEGAMQARARLQSVVCGLTSQLGTQLMSGQLHPAE